MHYARINVSFFSKIYKYWKYFSKYLRISKIISNFAAQNAKFCRISSRKGVSCNAGGWYGHIKKRRLKALCFGYLESRKFNKFQNIATQDAHWYVLKVRACVRICIRRGLQCCCLELKAMREPQIAEQQWCSPAFYLQKCKAEHCKAGPAFLCMYIY